jgi:hypothetical protein
LGGSFEVTTPAPRTTSNSVPILRANREAADRIKGSTSASENTIPQESVTNNDPNGRMMYPFQVKHLGKEVYTFYATTAKNRQDWCDKILEVQTRHAATLYEHNVEPFALRVMADTAFAYDSSDISRSIPTAGETPLVRALRDMEINHRDVPQPVPVCRARVNCATTYDYHGKSIVLVGTNYGVYMSEAGSPRVWNRVSTGYYYI